MEGAQLLGGRYVLLDEIGVGGMAVVWRARDEVLDRSVAVKLLAGKHAGEPDARDRIWAEARAAAALSHPNIAQVYDYGEASEYGAAMPYVVMELVRGGTLQDRMDAGPMSPRFAMRVAAEVSAALAAAHADGLVHRDIKPANVMLTPTGAKVVDFGIAAAINPNGTGDEEFEVLGTPAYLAPERLTGDGVEPASDIYALGVLLYRMLSGHSPWSADTTTQMLNAHVYIDPEPLPAQPGVPDYITALCNRCLSKDTTQRPSAREAAALLAQGAGLRVVEDAEPAGPGATGIDNEPSLLIRRRSAGRVAARVPDAVVPGVLAPGHADFGSPMSGGAFLSGPAAGEWAPAGPAPGDGASLAHPGDGGLWPGAGGGGSGGVPAATAFTTGASAVGSPWAARPGEAVAEGRSARSDGVAGFGGATGPARDPGGPAGVAAAGPAGARAASGARRRAAGRRRAKLLPFTAAAVLLATAGLLWWLLGPDAGDSRQPAAGPVFSAAPGSAGAPSVGAPSAGAPSATGKPAVPGGAPTRGVAVPAGAGDDVAPGGAPALPGVTPPAGGGPGATTTPPPGQEEPEPTATTTTPPTDPPAETRTLSSSAGSVRATCPSPSTAELLSWSAVKPYKVKDVDAGPGSNAVATFRHGNNVVRMTVTCSGGVPSASTDNG